MNKKYKILLTNDDGFDSPLFGAFIKSLTSSGFCSELRIVAPKKEQSWKSQSCTRFELLQVDEHFFGDNKGFVINGTPSDCVGLGLYNLYQEPADLVLSGINLGDNSSLPFYLNSGTIGAVRHAFNFGIKGIAFSVKLPTTVHQWWTGGGRTGDNMFLREWDDLAVLSVELINKLIMEECWQGVDLYTVNFPWNASAETEKIITEPERMKFTPPLYDQVEGGYRHHFRGFDRIHYQSNLAKDFTTLEQDRISISPISYDLHLKNKETLKYLQDICSPVVVDKFA